MDEEKEYLQSKLETAEKKIEEQNKFQCLMIAGGVGLGIYLMTGFSTAGGLIGFVAFVGIAIWKGCFF